MVYDTFDEVLTTVEAEKLLTRGYPIFRNPLRSTVEAVRGKNYYPMDNSYTENFTDGDRLWVANKVVTIISKPYMARTPYGDKMWFVIVKTEDGKVGRCLFMEWKLVP